MTQVFGLGSLEMEYEIFFIDHPLFSVSFGLISMLYLPPLSILIRKFRIETSSFETFEFTLGKELLPKWYQCFGFWQELFGKMGRCLS